LRVVKAGRGVIEAMRQARVVQKYEDAEVLAVMMHHQPYASRLLSDASASLGEGVTGSGADHAAAAAHRTSAVRYTSDKFVWECDTQFGRV
jgi:hypothetical protein